MQDMIVKAAFVGMNVKTGKTVMQFELDPKDIAMMPELAKAVGEVVSLDVHRSQGELPLDELMKPNLSLVDRDMGEVLETSH